MKLKRASLSLIPVCEDLSPEIPRACRYWSVSRRYDDIGQVGYVCGKNEPYEDPFQAALREAGEEIGLVLKVEDQIKLIPIYAGWDGDHWITAFLYPHAVKYSDLVMEKGLQARPVTPREMCGPEVSPFWKYNLGLFGALRRFIIGQHSQ
jgi:8-oxo-dGTP pyrophosphatase MutT (NUDIX family)